MGVCNTIVFVTGSIRASTDGAFPVTQTSVAVTAIAHGWATPSIVAWSRSPRSLGGGRLGRRVALGRADGVSTGPEGLAAAGPELSAGEAPAGPGLDPSAVPHAAMTIARRATAAMPGQRRPAAGDPMGRHTRPMTGPVASAKDAQVDRAREVRRQDEALTFPLRRHGGEALHRQIERRIRAAIADGRLRPGVRLMGTRVLAGELGVARITVQTAYDQLIAEGYLSADGRRGTFIATDLPDHWAVGRGASSPGRSDSFPVLNPWAASSSVTAPVASSAATIELGPEWFGMETFDARGWERLLVQAWRELATDPDSPVATYVGPLGDKRLRAALADHLSVRRGVRCDADAIALTAGSTAAFAAIARTWLGPGRTCAVEDPGGAQIRRALAGAGARIVPVPVDDRGIRVDRLPSRADVVFVTPSWQYPAGGSLSLPRRLALLQWATEVGAVVIEDDCESELRYDGQPLPSLQGLASDGRVVYVSTFSKVLFPGLRTGYMVVPDMHRGPLLAALESGGRPPGAVEQRALALLLEGGGFHRHIRRLGAAYAVRRDAFTRALAAENVGLEVRRASAGGHLIVGILDERWTASALAAGLAESGIRMEPLSANRLLAAADDELVVYLGRHDATALSSVAGELGRLMRGRPPGTSFPTSPR
jgi:GntR family transcriptional regulator/MocR family aminotransferase